MDRRVLGLVLAAVGLVVAIVSGLADVIGISFEDAADGAFGWIQIVGLVVGVALVVAGLVVALMTRDAGSTHGTA